MITNAEEYEAAIRALDVHNDELSINEIEELEEMVMHFEDNLQARMWELTSDIASKQELLVSLIGSLYPPIVRQEIYVMNKELEHLERLSRDTK